MKVLSLSEFAEYCSGQVSPVYIFSNRNQPVEYLRAISMVMRFDSVIVSLKPNRVCFMSHDNKICFEGVKEIQMSENDPSIGIFFKIVCVCGATEICYSVVQD